MIVPPELLLIGLDVGLIGLFVGFVEGFWLFGLYGGLVFDYFSCFYVFIGFDFIYIFSIDFGVVI
jgi:hypothetical protein